MKIPVALAALVAAFGFDAPTAFAAEIVWLHDLDLAPLKQSRGTLRVVRSSEQPPLVIARQRYGQGIATRANSTVWLALDGRAERFLAFVGVDAAAHRDAAVIFKVLGDGRTLFDSGAMRFNDAPRPVDADVRGIRRLVLQVRSIDGAQPFGHADWAEARFGMTEGKPVAMARPQEEKYLLTPKPGPAPRINAVPVYGCRPGRPFLYRIPTQGERPMTFAAAGLPASLVLDAQRGIVSGTAPARGEHPVTLRAKNAHGESTKIFRIVAGDALALTPPMGWNHWYAHYDRVTDRMMREAADTLIASGLADVGYDYVNIDDCWMNAPEHRDPLRAGPGRDENGRLMPNRHFPDMKALTAYIHGHGLKAGLYTSPGPLTCGGFTGAYKHEEQDARLFAEWGFDFLKYDWCSYGHVSRGGDPETPNLRRYGESARTLDGLKAPYRLMGRILHELPRDFVFNLCQYGEGNVWEWGAEAGGHSWRTAGDLGFDLDRIFDVALANCAHRDWQRPGAWNDPDYLQIGFVGRAHGYGEPAPCPLTPTEQYAFVSLWTLMAAPLFYSGDLRQLDDFTINALANADVIEVNQDPLGQCARVVPRDDERFLLIKDLADGSNAVGLCNRGEFPARVTVAWADAGLTGPRLVRDLWRQKDLGTFSGEFTADVPRHGVVLVRLRTTGPAR